MRNKILCQTLLLLLGAFVLLSYNDDPPNGRTGAPFNGHCKDCHTGNNPGGYNGLAEIIGLPDTIYPNTAYTLQIKSTVSSGHPVRGGFQLVVVDKNNFNAGNLSATNADADTEFLNGREYLDQREAKYFNGASVAWDFSWISPATAHCNTIKFYYIINFCNGSGDFGDFSIAFADSVYFAGGPLLTAYAGTIQHNTCLEDFNGIANVQASGGEAPYVYHWSNGISGESISALANGVYAVTVLDNQGCAFMDSTVISNMDTIAPQIICPVSFSVCEGDSVQFALPLVLDNCALDTIQAVLLSGLPSNSLFPPVITQQIFQVSDLGGNTASCSFDIQVNPKPIILLDTIVHDTGDSGTGSISVTAAGGTGSVFSYLWKKDGLFFSTGEEDISGLYSGAYTLELRDSLACLAISPDFVVENTVGVNGGLATREKTVVWPNPVSNVSFFLYGFQETPVALELINVESKIVAILPVSAWPGPYFIADIPNGFYFLRIRYAEGQYNLLPLIKS